MMLTQNNGKKVYSSSSTVTIIVPNTSQSSNSSSSSLNSNQTRNDQSNSCSSNQNSIKPTADACTDTLELADELDLKHLYKLSDKKKFPSQEFLIENKKKQYTPMLHFYNYIRIYNKHPEEHERFNFECKICKKSLLSPFTDKSHLYKHLQRHDDYEKWNEKYKNKKNKKVGPIIDETTMLLIKYFVTSNTSHSNLENQYLRLLLGKVIGTKKFSDTIIPDVYKNFRNKFKNILDNADDICLMSDIWTAKQNSDFIALAAAIMNENLRRNVLVLAYAYA